MRKSLHTTIIASGNQQALAVSTNTPPTNTVKQTLAFFLACVFTICFGLSAKADYTVASGANINASTITGQSGVLTINGTLTLSSSVSLLNFTSVIFNGPNGQIFWTNNSDLTFATGTTIVVNSGALGLQPTTGNGNASQRLIVGTTVISVSSDNANNAAFSFEQFNALGGLPQFTISGTTTACAGSPVSLTITPDRTSSVSYTYAWSISPSSGTFSTNNTSSLTSASTTITPAAGAYTITCSVSATGDALATKTIGITINPAATAPTGTATPTTICAGNSSNLKGISAGNTIKWYTLAANGTSIGTSASGANFSVSPANTTTYYAESTTASGCKSATRTAVTVTVNALPTVYSVTGGGSYCAGGTGVLVGLANSQSGVNYQLQINGVNTGAVVAGTGAALNFGSKTAAGTYTITAANATTLCANTMTGNAVVSINPKPTASISGTQLLCNGSSASLSISVTGVGPWTGTLSSGQAFAGSTSPISVSVSPSTTTSYTIATLSTASCPADAAALTGSATITIVNIGQWRGINTDWNDGQNWCTGAAPTSGTNITIPVTANNPIITTGTALANNITIANGATVTLNGGNLKFSGAISSTQAIVVTDGTIELNGTSLQTLAGSNFYSNTLKNIIVSNPVGVQVSSTLNDSLRITGAFTFGNVNNSTVYTGENIVLVSNSKGTARIADVSNNGINTGNKFSGNVVVERYFPTRRAWRLFTAPLSGAGSIFDNLQNKGVYKAGVGTYITGAGASNPTGTNGLDWSTLNNSSLKAGVSLTPVTNTQTTLLSKNVADTSDNIGYFLFVRGDRSAANTNPSASNNTTLSSKGKLQTGRQTFPASSSMNGFTLIGNPFASPVDVDKLVLKNIVKRFYVWDPYLNAEQGGYIVVDDFDGDGNYVMSPTSPGGMNQILQSGQAFFVQTASNSAASVTFHETAKFATNANLTAFRPMGQTQSFRVNLLSNTTGTSPLMLDGVYTEFDNSFSKEVGLEDAAKFGNVKEMLAIQRNTKPLMVERRPTLNSEDTIVLALTKTTQRSYQLEFVPANMHPSLLVVLEDSYTGTKKVLSPVQKTVYDFIINADAASAVSTRFRVVFRQVSISTLPVTFKDIKAVKQNENVAIEWTVENELNIKSYEVERSTDGIDFSRVASTNAREINGQAVYQSLDKAPGVSNNYYRVKSIGSDGKKDYSKTVLVKIAKNGSGLRIYPNPVTNSIVGVEFKNMAAGVYRTRLINAAGQTITATQLNHQGGSSMEYVDPGFKLVAGFYQLEVAAPGNSIRSIKVIVK